MPQLPRLLAFSSVVLGVLGCVQTARAEEPPERSPPPPVDAQAERVRALRGRAEEVEAELQLERSKQRLDEARRAEGPRDAERTPEIFRPGRVLLPELAGTGLSSLPLFGAGVGGAVFYSTGPITFSYGTNNTSETSLFAIAPSGDVVVSEHLTLGGSVAFARQTTRLTFPDATGSEQSSRSHASSFDVKPRVGIPQRLGGGVWVWPRLAARVGRSWADAEAGSGRATTLGVELDVPFVFPLSRWVFLQVAPTAGFMHVDPSAGSSGDSDTFAFGTYARLGLAL